jgi:hypothetical protein
MGIARLGDGALATALTAGGLRGGEPQVLHQLARMIYGVASVSFDAVAGLFRDQRGCDDPTRCGRTLLSHAKPHHPASSGHTESIDGREPPNTKFGVQMFIRLRQRNPGMGNAEA